MHRKEQQSELVDVEGILEHAKADNIKQARNASKYIGTSLAAFIYSVSKKEINRETENTTHVPEQKNAIHINKKKLPSPATFSSKKAELEQEIQSMQQAIDEKEKAKQNWFKFHTPYSKNKEVETIKKRVEARKNAIK